MLKISYLELDDIENPYRYHYKTVVTKTAFAFGPENVNAKVLNLHRNEFSRSDTLEQLITLPKEETFLSYEGVI